MPRPSPSTQPYVFISYASTDRERVLPVVAAIRSLGVAVWLDQHDIEGGANWAGRIADAIESCDALVLMSSAASLASRNVAQELGLAWRAQKPYVPLLLDLTPAPAEVRYFLEMSQWIEVLDHPAEVWLPKLEQALARVGMATSAPTSTSHPPRSQASNAPPVAFDALSASRAVPSQLWSIPSPLTALVGRDEEVTAIGDLLKQSRLVTLTGPGGVGKTRLAIAVAHAVGAHYPDGAVFVDLSALTDPTLVLPTIAAALGVCESGEEPIQFTLARAISQRQMLLVLDNLEHVIDAAREISALLTSCPNLRALATSRIPLRVSGEREHHVEPLPVPDGAGDACGVSLTTTAGGLTEMGVAASPAVALFVDRAQAVRPRFELTPDNAEAVAAICQRLDGLPLAIELAAARAKLLSPHAILARLEHPLAVLTGGARDRPERQQTLEAAIHWSYDLLTPEEQRLFRRLAVFVGGWTVESAEAVVNADDLGIDVLDGLASLVDKSLVVQRDVADGDVRFSMLTTIRTFALDELERAGETSRTLTALADVLLALVDDADLDREEGATFTVSLDRIERELPNLRVALDWLLDHDGDRLFRLLCGLFNLWYTRGYMAEGRRYLETALDRWPDAPVSMRVTAHNHTGMLAALIGAAADAERSHAEALRLSREIDDPVGICEALFGLARASHFSGDLARGRAFYEESLTLARSIGDEVLISNAAGNLAMVLALLGDDEQALSLNAASLTRERARGSELGMAIRTVDRAWLFLKQGDLAYARELQEDGLRLSYRVGLMRYVGESLTHLGIIAAATGDLDRAALLLGAGRRIRTDLHYSVRVAHTTEDAQVAVIRARIGPERFDALAAQGAALSIEEVVALALPSSIA